MLTLYKTPVFPHWLIKKKKEAEQPIKISDAHRTACIDACGSRLPVQSTESGQFHLPFLGFVFCLQYFFFSLLGGNQLSCFSV